MEKQKWSFEIGSRTRWFDFHLKELWEYRNLVLMFTKRNFTTMYKQTILGPLWIVLNPLISTLMFTIVFGKIANISTEGVPDYIFYMAGNIVWSFFASSLQKTSVTFTGNAHIFGKVYFPRLAVPISNVLTQVISFLLQFIIFLGFIGYAIIKGADIHLNYHLLLLPLLLMEIGILSVGFGILISALTAKYRDLVVLIGFGLQLWMYGSPVVYPASVVPEKYLAIFKLNPMAPIIETFRYAFLGTGSFSWEWLGISFMETLAVFGVGLVLFNKVEKTFMDIV